MANKQEGKAGGDGGSGRVAHTTCHRITAHDRMRESTAVLPQDVYYVRLTRFVHDSGCAGLP